MQWRITQPHYLRVKFKNPNDNQDVTYDVLFECDGDNPADLGKGTKYRGREYIYLGPPTPDMEPLDREAEEAKKKYDDAQAKRLAVINPIEALPIEGV